MNERVKFIADYLQDDELADYAAPNAIWCADFEGHFPVADARCHPLTIMDGFSRYLLRCESLRRPLSGPVQKVFESTFREYGLPQTVHRQRTALLDLGTGRPVTAGRVVDSPRHSSGADRPRSARSERPPRTDAQHSEGGDSAAAAPQLARPAALLPGKEAGPTIGSG